MCKNSSARYHQENKKRIRKKACERYQNLSTGEKEKGQQYIVNGTNIYKEMKNKRFVAYRKKYYKIRKNALL